MEAVQESVLQGRFGDAAEQLEEAELRAEDAALATWPYVLQVLLYLAEGETEMARLAWKRMPPVMQSSGEAQEVHGLLRALWQRDLSAAWGAMPRISRLLEGAALARIQARLREEAVNAIEEAYAAIDVGTACAMCGVEPLQLNELAERCGWRSEGDVLVISRRAPSKVEGAGLVDLKALSQYVVKLE